MNQQAYWWCNNMSEEHNWHDDHVEYNMTNLFYAVWNKDHTGYTLTNIGVKSIETMLMYTI